MQGFRLSVVPMYCNEKRTFIIGKTLTKVINNTSINTAGRLQRDAKYGERLNKTASFTLFFYWKYTYVLLKREEYNTSQSILSTVVSMKYILFFNFVKSRPKCLSMLCMFKCSIMRQPGITADCLFLFIFKKLEA